MDPVQGQEQAIRQGSDRGGARHIGDQRHLAEEIAGFQHRQAHRRRLPSGIVINVIGEVASESLRQVLAALAAG